MDIVFKDEGNQIMIKGLAQCSSGMKAVHIAKVLHQKMPRKFEKPDFKFYPLREWLAFRDELKRVIRYTKIQEKVAVFLNGKWVGNENDLLIALKPYITFVPEFTKYDERMTDDKMQLFGVNPKQSLIYFDFAIKDEIIGRVFFEIFSEAMPNLTKRFIQLCKNEPISLRKQLNPEYTKSEESILNENTLLKVFDAEDPEAFRDGKMEYLSYLNTYITRIVPQSFFQAGKIIGVDEWIDGELERDMLPHANTGDISLITKPGWGKRSELISLNEFIISLKPNTWMNGRYRCIGRLVHGQDVLDKINEVPNNYGDPLLPIIIHGCGVVYSPFDNKTDEDKEEGALQPLQVNEVDEEDELFLENYKAMVYAYYYELCELQLSLDNEPPVKELEFYYNIRDTFMSTHTSEYFTSESDYDSVKYDDMLEMSLRHSAKFPYNLEVNKSVMQAEALALQLYKFLRPLTLEELLLEEKYLDGPDLIEHGLFFQCDLADSMDSNSKGYSKSTDYYDSVDRDMKANSTLSLEGELLSEELDDEDEEEIIFGPDETSEEFVIDEQDETITRDQNSLEEPGSRESSPPAQQSTRSSSVVKSALSLPDEETPKDTLGEAGNVQDENSMLEMEDGEMEGLEEDGGVLENVFKHITEDKYTLPDYVTPAYLLEMAYEPNLIPRQILEYIFESVIKPKSKVNLDEDVMNVMRTDDFQTALKSLPSEKLRNIARQMEGVKQDLLEMEKYPQDEESIKREDAVISSCLSQFTQNMLEFYLREMYVNVMPGEYNITRSMVNIKDRDDSYPPVTSTRKSSTENEVDENTDIEKNQSENQIESDVSVKEKELDDTDDTDEIDVVKETTIDDVILQPSDETVETPLQTETEEEIQNQTGVEQQKETVVEQPNQTVVEQQSETGVEQQNQTVVEQQSLTKVGTEESLFKGLDIIEDEELEQIKQTDSKINEEQELIPDELELIQDEGEFDF